MYVWVWCVRMLFWRVYCSTFYGRCDRAVVIIQLGFMKNAAIAANMATTTMDVRFSACYVGSNENRYKSTDL